MDTGQNNVLGGIPTLALDQGPAGTSVVHLDRTGPCAISQGFRGQLEGEFTVLTFVDDDFLAHWLSGGGCVRKFRILQ